MAHFTYGRAELAKGNMVQAVARLTKAVALEEKLGDARLLRAQALMQMGDYQGATEDVEWLLEYTEENEDVTLLHARLERAKGNNEKAVEIYGKVTDLNPFQIDAYRERGQILFEMGDKHGAEEDMQKVLELNPQEMADVNGEYSAEGIEHKVRQAYSNLNPFGI
jgi:tetratricopeptide (TPR) repeat protein